MHLLNLSFFDEQVGKYWPKETRKVHLAQAKEQRRKNQSLGIQAKLDSHQVFSSNSNSSSANRSKKGLNDEENINIVSPNASPTFCYETGITQTIADDGNVLSTDMRDMSNSKITRPSLIIGRKSPTRSHYTEPVILSVTTVQL